MGNSENLYFLKIYPNIFYSTYLIYIYSPPELLMQPILIYTNVIFFCKHSTQDGVFKNLYSSIISPPPKSGRKALAGKYHIISYLLQTKTQEPTTA